MNPERFKRNGKRARKMRSWTSHKSARHARRNDRRFSDFWVWTGQAGHARVAVPGRLIPVSKLRGRRSS